MDFFFVAFVFLFGLVVGSFLNVLTLRLVAEESIVWPASHCPHCKHALAWFDLIPVVSFLERRGRCRYCRKSISWQYPLVELATAVAFALVAWVHRDLLITGSWFAILLFARDLLFTTGLIALFIFDFRWYIVPDEVSLPLIGMAVVLNLVLRVSWLSLLVGVVVGGGFYFLLWSLSKGKWVGSGDIRLGALLGVMLGWPGTLFALYVAYLVGGFSAIVLLATNRKKMKSLLPMGVFLTIGAFAVILFSSWLMAWWNGLMVVLVS